MATWRSYPGAQPGRGNTISGLEKVGVGSSGSWRSYPGAPPGSGNIVSGVEEFGVGSSGYMEDLPWNAAKEREHSLRNGGIWSME